MRSIATSITKHLRLVYRYAPGVALLVSSCVTPYPLDYAQFQEEIVVQGMITDQPGPYEIVVSQTIPVQDQIESVGELSGASVKIEDDMGNHEQLVEKTTGHFFTTSIQGTVGRTYTLTVTTAKGDVYQSTPEKLLPVGDFTIRQEFKQVEDSMANLQISSANGFNIYINSEVLPEQEGRVWWRTSQTYHVLTFPGSRKVPAGGRPPADGVVVLVPAAPPCAGTAIRPVCTCCDCWITSYNQTPLLSDQRFIHNGQINDLKIGFAEANRRTLYDKFYFEVDQLSVSETVYAFWKRIAIQKSNSSNLFQTPSPKTGGNLTALNSHAAPVIGYFAASSIVKKSIVLTAKDVPYKILSIDEIYDSCLTVYRNSTSKKPSFW